MTALAEGPDGRKRCWWATSAPEFLAYHDEEWGRPVTDDRGLFERLCLEAFQSGLSWLTVLRKRAAFREAFADFEIDRVAGFDGRDVRRLLTDPRIIRNRAKIDAAIANARAAQLLAEDGDTLSHLIWSFEPKRPRAPRRGSDIASSTPESTALAKELKGRGFRFLGPTTAYALMQACGIVDDHLAGCSVRDAVERERRRVRPQ